MAKQEYNKDAKRKEAATPQESRQQQKKQRIERVLAQPSGELKLAARKLWETLRQRDLEASVRSQKMTEMMALLSGHIKEITFKHDMSRVLQTCLKYGTAKQRDQIAEELRGGFVELAKSTYGRHIVLRLLKLSNRFRGEIIESFYGQVRKLIKHKDAGMVVEECYATYANARQRWLLSAEMYGNEFAVFKDDQLKSLDEVLAKNPQKRQPAMLSLKGALTPLLEKATVGQSIVHRALLDFLRHADHPQRMEMIETMRELVVEILHTRDGAHAGMLCLLHGTAKDRKAIVKSIKPFAERVAKEEYGHAVILQAMDCVDDTVFVNKTLVPELLSNAHELLADKYGRRVILYVLAGRCPQYVGSEALKVLEAGDSVRAVTSKKDPGARQRELAGPVSERLLLWVAGNADTAIFDPMPSQAVSETLLRALGDKQQAWEAVLALVRRQISDKHVLVDPIANRVITNCIIAEHTKPEGAVVGDQNPRFGSDVLSALEEEGLLVDAAVAGAFPVRALLESPVTGPKAKELLQGARAQIAQAMDKAEKKRVYEAILALLG